MTCGVYEIWIDKYFYQGSSFNIEDRIKRHRYKLNNGIHGNKKMQNVFNKHSKAFSWQILVECDKSVTRDYEQDYIDANWGDKLYLNASKSAAHPLQDKPWNKGLKDTISDETRKVLSDKKLGNTFRRGKKASDETKSKLTSSLIGNKRRCVEIQYEGIQYASIGEACEALGVTRKVFSRMLKNTEGGYHSTL
jgi:group I intron endonuclease